MHITKVINVDGDQAVLLPAEFAFGFDEVEIFRRGDDIVLRKLPENLAQAFFLLTELPVNFLSER